MNRPEFPAYGDEPEAPVPDSGTRQLLGWLWAGYGLAVSYQSAICLPPKTMGWLWAIHQPVLGWLYRMATVWDGYWLDISWLWPKINTLQDTVI